MEAGALIHRDESPIQPTLGSAGRRESDGALAYTHCEPRFPCPSFSASPFLSWASRGLELSVHNTQSQFACICYLESISDDRPSLGMSLRHGCLLLFSR